MVIIVLEDISFTIPSKTNSRRAALNRPAEHYLSPKAQIRRFANQTGAMVKNGSDLKEAPACVSPGPPVSIDAEAQTIHRHNHRIC
jgi:hypothetical protein